MNTRHVDVLIVGAGISGVGAAYHLQDNCPGKTYAVIESRDAVGGTWDLFRYPGIRSDSDMYTFGFNFKPWVSPKAISPGGDIRRYIAEAAAENGIDKHIHFGHRVIAADWCSKTALWKAQVRELASGEVSEISSHFFFSGGGYYNYDEGYTPEFDGVESFRGQVIHPQKWPADLDYAGKKIIVIGSGATAVTLVPSLAETAANVIMLQRSPTYIASRPEQDAFGNAARKYLPAGLAYSVTRWKNILWGMYTYRLSRRRPELIKKFIINGVREYLGRDYDVEKHFTPSYNPWDQRVCLVPDGDLFKAIKRGAVTMVTDHIDRFTETGIALKSGEQLAADIIVTATGLNAEIFSGMQLSVDGTPVEPAKTVSYKGMMLSGLPNFVFSMGYTNASWTLKSDLVGEYMCRLLKYMDKHGFRMCVPTLPAEGIEPDLMMNLTSGYVLRARDSMPRQGAARPWKLYQNYILDRFSLGMGSVTDSGIRFS
ncbi:MAG: NAD(P)/FAD-dependent oxidoreductase [Pseudomonadales bacterium]|nr:NAD(P)/FAD-dependent oxidoreductase [Pseudomonadales bacterium]